MVGQTVVPRYRVYVLRLWNESEPEQAHSESWRFSLEDPVTNKRHGFATLEDMVAFIERELNNTATLRPERSDED